MANPVYAASTSPTVSAPLETSTKLAPLKYHTKIDAGIRINDLTQEVNMPLLRLVHQIYSIIADAIEYDKEQNKQSMVASISEEEKKKLEEAGTGSKLNSFKMGQTGLLGQQNFGNSRDCWRYMAGLIELRDFIPEPKYVEKVLIIKI